MNKHLPVFATATLFGLGLALPLLAFGQGPAPAPPGQHWQMGGRPGMHGGQWGAHGGDRMRRMDQALGLSPKQQAKIGAITQASRPAMMAIFSNPKLSPQQKMEKSQAIQRAQMAKINAILTPGQRAKFAALRSQMAKHRGPGGPFGQHPGPWGPGSGRGPNHP